MVTIKDVAREANVSVATVSRVLNGSGPVSEATSRRIREVAGRLRYVPHGGARSLITSRTDTLGVLLPDLYGEFFSEVIRGMDDTAQRQGFHLLISRSYADRNGIETAMRAMKGRVDGVVAMSPDLAPPQAAKSSSLILLRPSRSRAGARVDRSHCLDSQGNVCVAYGSTPAPEA